MTPSSLSPVCAPTLADIAAQLQGYDPQALRADQVTDFLARLAGTEGVEGVGFVTAFPHITKVFRYAPKAEILMLDKSNMYWTSGKDAIGGEPFIAFRGIPVRMIDKDILLNSETAIS